MKELTNKIEKIIKAKFPSLSQLEIDKMLEEYGEMAMLEFLNEVLTRLSDNSDREIFKNLFQDFKTEEAFEFLLSKGINAEEIYTNIGKSIVQDIFE